MRQSLAIHIRSLLIFAPFLLGLQLVAQEQVWKMHTELGGVALQKLDYREAADQFRRALNEAVSLKFEDERRIESLGNLAGIQQRLGLFTEAEQNCRDWIATAEKIKGPDSEASGDAYRVLGSVLLGQGRYKESRAAYDRGLAILTNVVQDDHPRVALVRSSLAELAGLEGQIRNPEAVFRDPLGVLTESYGKDHLVLAAVLASRARQWLVLGETASARTDAERAIEIGRQALPKNHPDLSAWRALLGAILYAQGDIGEASKLLEESLQALRGVFAPDHDDVLSVQLALANAEHSRGMLAEAKRDTTAVLAAQERRLGPQHPAIAATLNQLAEISLSTREFDEVQEPVMRARSLLPGKGHPEFIRSSRTIALLHREQRAEDAAALFDEALVSTRESFGRDNPDVAEVIVGVGLVQSDTGEFKTAEENFRKAIGIFEDKLGNNNCRMLPALEALGKLYFAQARFADAEMSYSRAVGIRERTMGANHPSLFASLKALENIYKALGQQEQAQLLSARATQLRSSGSQ